MLERGKIEGKQAIFLMVSMVIATASIFITSSVARLAKQDSWISMLLAILLGLLIAWLAVNLSLRFPGKTIFQYPEAILGRWPGKVVALLYIWFYIHINGEIIREYGTFLVSAFMPETPMIVFMILIVGIAAYAVRNGLEVFTRANEIVLPVILVSNILLVIMATPEMDLKKLLPVFVDNGSVPIIKGAAMPALWMGEIFIMAVLIPYLNKTKEAFKIAASATIITRFFMIIAFVDIIAIFGPEVTAGWFFPALNGARMIHLANFLDRLEPIIMIIWVAGALIKISILYRAAVLGSVQWLELKDYKPLVLPVGVILLALSIMAHDSIMDLFAFLSLFAPAELIFMAGIPLLLLVVAVIRGQGVKQN
ncbi:endospore germination permease [Pelotomaculum isophthalicicum JI]|uniref:Endospore germination permease n=1 Tax=Pelotomaculum isophthalicicum JI TaxID=947010 RepID=A0A9X4H2I6_9FIRM|nr:endospore germination permease [Pelotomaculum isophthalicicum]MDF9408401.1 endospore germination permease [Pelotomaculum isophthalicicum JI]